jgi:hypothetical protein
VYGVVIQYKQAPSVLKKVNLLQSACTSPSPRYLTEKLRPPAVNTFVFNTLTGIYLTRFIRAASGITTDTRKCEFLLNGYSTWKGLNVCKPAQWQIILKPFRVPTWRVPPPQPGSKHRVQLVKRSGNRAVHILPPGTSVSKKGLSHYKLLWHKPFLSSTTSGRALVFLRVCYLPSPRWCLANSNNWPLHSDRFTFAVNSQRGGLAAVSAQ